MICPVCKTDMAVIEYNDIELDFCAQCRGVWFDSGELELMFKLQRADDAASFLSAMIEKPEAATTEKTRSCPICRRKMSKKEAGEASGLLVDVCKKGHGLWFDGGEVIQFAEHISRKDGPVGETNAVIGYLREFFGDVR